jgi:hypothetical protein
MAHPAQNGQTVTVPRLLHSADDFDLEFDALVRQFDGLVQQVRMENLGRELDRGPPIAVSHSTCGFCGDRFKLWLDDGTVLKLKLLWPHRCALAAICQIRWAKTVGWIVAARTTAGEPVVIYCWKAKVSNR